MKTPERSRRVLDLLRNWFREPAQLPLAHLNLSIRLSQLRSSFPNSFLERAASHPLRLAAGFI
jgi:hypothetical protein